ncbi:MAG: hypothetical protein R3D67_01305 [Hyphomicrobiaceae bacterium]
MHKLSATQTEKILAAFKTWSDYNTGVKGIAVVGSWDEEQRAHAEADLDLVLVVDDPNHFRNDTAWMTEIDWKAAELGPGHWSECDYAQACSRHLKFDDGAEVEVSFVAPQWAATDPVDKDTRRMAGTGMRVVHDPGGLLGKLLSVL